MQSKQETSTNEDADINATAKQIARYYDANTEHFLRFGGAGDTAAIHRAIWAPGVKNRDDAFLYLNRLIATAIISLIDEDVGTLHVLDLGCGVGGTTTWLAQALGARVTGVTISEQQRAIAEQRAARLGVADMTDFITADFNSLPEIEPAQAACAIESFVHASDASQFFAMASRQIATGGKLIICDDFLNPPLSPQTTSPQAKRWVTRFARGWHLNNLLSVAEVKEHAAKAGFRLVEKHNLSAYLRGFHPLYLWFITTLTLIPLRWPYWQNLSGGTALQICVRRGWTKYQALVWEKAEN